MQVRGVKSVVLASFLLAAPHSALAEEAGWKSREQKLEEALREKGVTVEQATPSQTPEPPVRPVVFAFDFSNPQIDTTRIRDGGILPDGIPAINVPMYETIHTMEGLQDDDYVIVVKRAGEARAYPIRLLNWHGIVNDTLGDERITISWDAPSGSAVAFKRVKEGVDLEFGVSGLIYQSCALYYDRATQSLWSPMALEALTGPYAGQKLEDVPLSLMYWREFKNAYPTGSVVSFNTGYNRDYSQNPYGDYGRSKRLMFPVIYHSDALPRKEPIFGVRLQKGTQHVAAAFPVNKLLSWGDGTFHIRFAKGELPMKLHYDKAKRSFRVSAPEGVEIDTMYASWFAWSAFNPQTLVIQDLP